MARRGKKKGQHEAPKPAPGAPAFRPFADALKSVARAAKTAPAAKIAVPEPPPPEDDRALLDAAFAGVKPLERRQRERVAPPPKRASSAAPYDEDADTLAKLAAMVEGSEPLSSEFSDEHTEWIDEDADPGILPRLVAGEFAWQEHIDLHGMTREEARAAITRFLASARLKHHRCVLIVTGRGIHSEDSVPVLKIALQRWLRRAPLDAWVFAWATARPVDGGAGAIYVLLRN